MTVTKKALLWFVGVLIFTIIYAIDSGLNFDIVGLSFLVISTQSLFATAFIGPRNVSLIKVYFIFSYLFLSLIPWYQYSYGIVLWGGSTFLPGDYLITNLLIFSANVFVFLIYLNETRKARKRKVAPKPGLAKQGRGLLALNLGLVALSTASLFAVFYINNFSIALVFFRGVIGESRESVIESSSISLVFSLVARLIPLFVFLFSYTRSNSSWKINSVLFVLLLLCVFPTGVARYMVGFVYIPVLLAVFKKTRNAIFFSSALIFSIFIIFPFLNNFRYFDEHQRLSITLGKDLFETGNYDAYQNLARVIQVDFITYGFQLLGVMLFFVPRTFWPGKPVGSGYQLAEDQSYLFNNISMPFLGEGYVNFGFLGVFVFSFVLAKTMAKLDVMFSFDLLNNKRIVYSTSVYLYICGALFFMLRGDLLSSTAYVTAGLFSAYFVHFFSVNLRRVFR